MTIELSVEVWNKMIEADKKPINHEAIEKFLRSVKEFEEKHKEIEIHELS